VLFGTREEDRILDVVLLDLVSASLFESRVVLRNMRLRLFCFVIVFVESCEADNDARNDFVFENLTSRSGESVGRVRIRFRDGEFGKYERLRGWSEFE